MTRIFRLISAPALVATGFVLALLSTPRAAEAATESVLYSFSGPDGNEPRGALIADARGSFYGTTNFGGGVGDCGFGEDGCGAVFKLTKNRVRVLHAFGAAGDGRHPTCRLLLDVAGNLFGTTDYGGTGSKFFGTVFKLSADNRYSILYSFKGGSDGSGPISGLVADASGNFYGTTTAGGTGNCIDGCGTVFKITPVGQKTLVYAFKGGTDGGVVKAGVAIDAEGNLYGTTNSGGAFAGGTVFKITPAGEKTTLYSFSGGDGYHPYGGVVLDAEGNLYGTTFDGGICGTIFKLTPEGLLSVLHSFDCQSGSGYPISDLIIDAEGNLYGTTSYFFGSAFKLAPDGTFTTLYSFQAGSDGATPVAGLLLDQRWSLYGTTTNGGVNEKGTVFKLVP